MALFRRKKKVVKPTVKEQKKIGARLRRKYPQMYKPVGMSKQQQKAYDVLSPADKETMKKMRGTTMKKIYGKK